MLRAPDSHCLAPDAQAGSDVGCPHRVGLDLRRRLSIAGSLWPSARGGRARRLCEYIDLTVSWVDDADMPEHWQCPRCGGTEYEFVHPDYPPSGFHPGQFEVVGWEEC